MTHECIYFKDETCESLVMNDKTCNNCLIRRQAGMLSDILDRLVSIEILVKKTPARKTPVRKAK